MKKLLLVLLSLPIISSSQTWQWVQREGAGNNDYIYSISTDSVNNCYIAGRFGISKYSYSGSLIWHDSTSYWSLGVCYSQNKVCTVGDSFGIEIATQYDVNGNLLWKRNFGTGGYAYSKIVADRFGALYVSGTGSSFLSKIDTAGNLVWAQTSSALANSICSDVNENTYLTGYFSGTAHFGGDSLTAIGYQDIFIAKYDSSGNCLWARRAGGNSPDGYHDDFGWGITADTLGHVYLTGSFYGIADFGTDTLHGVNGNEVFVAKYDDLGNEIWVKAATGWSDQEGRCIAIDAEGNILIGGSYVPDIYFGTYQQTGWLNYDAFVAKYDPNGNFISVLVAGSTTWNEFVKGICTDNTGNVFVTGEYSSFAVFGSDTLISYGLLDTYIAKISFLSGVNELSPNSEINFFPNPVANVGYFHFSGSAGQRTILIFDQLGREIWRKNTDENTVEFSVIGYVPGMYFYRIETDQLQPISGKFLIQ